MRNKILLLKAFCLLIIITFSGCASTPKEITTRNFLEKIKITKLDKKLFSADYVGNEISCFPPAGKRICTLRNQDEDLYRKKDILEMEIIELFYEFDEHGIQTETASEFSYLIIATAALDLGYSMFTPINKILEISCSTNESTMIHGSLTNSGGFGNFSGRTIKSESKTCKNNFSENFYFSKIKIF